MAAEPGAPPAAAPAAEPPRGGRRGPLRYAGRIVAVAIAVLFVGLLTYGVLSKAQNTTVDDRLAHDESVPAPGFTLPVLSRGALGRELSAAVARATRGGRVSLAGLRGTPVVLNFWASWCIPCRQEAAALERAWRRSRPQGVLFVGLNMQDLTEDARAFAESVGMSYLTVRDRGNDVARSYGATGIPETFFIDADGQVVGHVVGAVSLAQARRGAAAAKSGTTIGVQTGGEQGTQP
jgi:cytochrome c biogenesis protein CcmG, thiol:disulfide interchange protein DsbE